MLQKNKRKVEFIASLKEIDVLQPNSRERPGLSKSIVTILLMFPHMHIWWALRGACNMHTLGLVLESLSI